MRRITAYIVPTCPYCKAAIAALCDRDPVIIDVEQRPQLRARLAAETGSHTLPSVWVDGVYIGGMYTGPAPFFGLASVIRFLPR
jgi:glutaredoxin